MKRWHLVAVTAIVVGGVVYYIMRPDGKKTTATPAPAPDSEG